LCCTEVGRSFFSLLSLKRLAASGGSSRRGGTGFRPIQAVESFRAPTLLYDRRIEEHCWPLPVKNSIRFPSARPPAGKLAPVPAARFTQELADVPLDAVGADSEAGADLRVGPSSDKSFEDCPLALVWRPAPWPPAVAFFRLHKAIIT